MLVHSHWLNKIWFLRGAEKACLVQLALRMEPFVFAPSELPETNHLYARRAPVLSPSPSCTFSPPSPSPGDYLHLYLYPVRNPFTFADM